MYNNNLFLDYKNNIKIPSTDKSFYEITGNLFLKHTISVKVERDYDLANLYFILKSFSCNLIYIPHNFFTVINNSDDFFVAHAENVRIFKQMGYLNFLNWFSNRIENDWKYIKNDGVYLLTFTYPMEIFDREKILWLKPIYPWNKNIIEEIGSSYEKEKKYEEIIKNKNDKIKELEDTIKKLLENRK